MSNVPWTPQNARQLIGWLLQHHADSAAGGRISQQQLATAIRQSFKGQTHEATNKSSVSRWESCKNLPDPDIVRWYEEYFNIPKGLFMQALYLAHQYEHAQRPPKTGRSNRGRAKRPQIQPEDRAEYRDWTFERYMQLYHLTLPGEVDEAETTRAGCDEEDDGPIAAPGPGPARPATHPQGDRLAPTEPSLPTAPHNEQAARRDNNITPGDPAPAHATTTASDAPPTTPAVLGLPPAPASPEDAPTSHPSSAGSDQPPVNQDRATPPGSQRRSKWLRGRRAAALGAATIVVLLGIGAYAASRLDSGDVDEPKFSVDPNAKAHVLFLIDLSQSMADHTLSADPSSSRIESARKFVAAGIESRTTRYSEVGVWLVTNSRKPVPPNCQKRPLADSEPQTHCILRPLAAATRGRRATLAEKIRHLPASGATPLYPALGAAIKELANPLKGDDPHAIPSVVVVTDGVTGNNRRLVDLATSAEEGTDDVQVLITAYDKALCAEKPPPGLSSTLTSDIKPLFPWYHCISVASAPEAACARKLIARKLFTPRPENLASLPVATTQYTTPC